MTTLYTLLYIYTDKSDYSEVLGVYSTLDKAIDELLERANYREKGGVLTQYMEPTNEYPNLTSLKNIVRTNLELIDEDIYRIVPLQLDSGIKQTREHIKKQNQEQIELNNGRWYHA